MTQPARRTGHAPRIAIIGAGFGGLAAAIELKKRGFDDLVVLERAADVGGVWRDNTYPGAACDVPTPYYSLSYEPNPHWPRRYATQPDIHAYLRHVAEKYDVQRHICFRAEVTSAAWDEAAGCWRLRTAAGDEIEADVLVPAVGQLSRPSYPAIKGLSSFAGPCFHSARWDHTVDLTGKRVGVIGTGASAIQFVPEIQPVVSSLTVFQRTPPYLVPRMDTEFSPVHHRIFERAPFTQKSERGAWFAVSEGLGVALLYSKPLARAVERLSRWHMRRGVGDDPELFAKVWPSYPIGCKRILFSNDYLPALTQPNVELVTSGIEQITASGVDTRDGVGHELDVLILGTGFTATDFLAPMQVRGLGGRDLREEWKDGARAYLGIAVPHFPNLFIMYGPNTNLGSGSIVYMLESQARYVGQAVSSLVADSGRPIVVRPEVEAAYDREVQDRLVAGVWSQCSNWYRAANGRVTTNWPRLPIEYRRTTARFDRDAYQTVG
jgi:cation diffusion facilitator CzcD-associated flavoprotein CzcO